MWSFIVISVCKIHHIMQHVQCSLPEDELEMFETCRRQEELN
jgi:hypothetical protein